MERKRPAGEAALRASLLARRRALPAPARAAAAARVQDALRSGTPLQRAHVIARTCRSAPSRAAPTCRRRCRRARPGSTPAAGAARRPRPRLGALRRPAPWRRPPGGCASRPGPRLGVDGGRRARTWWSCRRWPSTGAGMRLGRGGGSYDRALARVPAGRADRGAAARRRAGAAPVPAEPHDRPGARGVITPAPRRRAARPRDWTKPGSDDAPLALGDVECQASEPPEDHVPTYQYACTACGHQLEAVQSFSDEPLTECPACEGRLRKVFTSVGIVFKGSGFYRTDSRGAAKADSSTSPNVRRQVVDGEVRPPSPTRSRSRRRPPPRRRESKPRRRPRLPRRLPPPEAPSRPDPARPGACRSLCAAASSGLGSAESPPRPDLRTVRAVELTSPRPRACGARACRVRATPPCRPDVAYDITRPGNPSPTRGAAFSHTHQRRSPPRFGPCRPFLPFDPRWAAG